MSSDVRATENQARMIGAQDALSADTRRLWFIDQMEDGKAAYRTSNCDSIQLTNAPIGTLAWVRT